jgi:DNA-directed RNA polymerase specialized sigma24 family protein
MRDARVESAVSFWRRRVGQSAVFDIDDARQEAAIAIWRAGEAGTSTTGYRRIIDAIRKLTPGWRRRKALFVQQSDDDLETGKYEGVDPITPERTLEARQLLTLLENMDELTIKCVRLVAAGVSVSEICVEVGRSHPTVAAHIRKAQARIQSASRVCSPSVAVDSVETHEVPEDENLAAMHEVPEDENLAAIRARAQHEARSCSDLYAAAMCN